MKQNGMALTARSESLKAMSEFSRFNIASVYRTDMTLLTCTKTGPQPMPDTHPIFR
jgi:hypothetical protein